MSDAPKSGLGGAPTRPSNAESPTQDTPKPMTEKERADELMKLGAQAASGSTSPLPSSAESKSSSADSPQGAETGAAAELPPDAPTALADAAERARAGAGPDRSENAGKDEVGVLNYLLGANRPLEYDVKAYIDTAPGTRETLTFHIRQCDGKRLDEIEQEHSTGAGPFARADNAAIAAEIAAEAVLYMIDSKGQKIEPTDPQWIGSAISPAEAMRQRFRFQMGVLEVLIEEVRRISGYGMDRVGRAERAITDAAGNS